MVDALAVEQGVGAGEVDELEQAEGGVDRVGGERVQRPVPGPVYHDDLARFQLTNQVGSDDVERRCLGGQHPAAVEATQAERPEPVGVAHADDAVPVGDDQREGTLEGG